jgi:hypothetical protein
MERLDMGLLIFQSWSIINLMDARFVIKMGIEVVNEAVLITCSGE